MCEQLRTKATKHMIGSFTGLSTGSIETRSDGCPPIRSCIHYHILWLSRFASRQRGLSPLIGKHLRNWHRGFCRPFYMQSHRRYSPTKRREMMSEQQREEKQSRASGFSHKAPAQAAASAKGMPPIANALRAASAMPPRMRYTLAEPCAPRAPQACCGLPAAPLPWRKGALSFASRARQLQPVPPYSAPA